MKNFKQLAIILALGAGSVHAASFVLTGDSTMATYKTGEKQGWGAALSKYLVSGNKVTNRAAGGRSTKTFVSEKKWSSAVSLKANFVFIQFGHNDQSKKHTKAETTFKAALRKMVTDVKKYGGTPVLLSPVRRLRFSDSNRMSTELEPFARAAREVAAEEKVPFLDMHDRLRSAYTKMGEKNALKLFAKGDRTHTNSKGADFIASVVAQAAALDPVLSKHFK